MSDDDNERAAALTEHGHAPAHELRADAQPLAAWQHGHRGQAHPDDSSRCALDDHRSKEDVTDDDVCHRDEGQRGGAGGTESINEHGLRRLPERELVEPSYRWHILRTFETDRYHARSSRSDVRVRRSATSRTSLPPVRTSQTACE